MRAIQLLILFATSSWPEGAFGTWKMNPDRSTFNGSPHPESSTVRIEPHTRGEVFTMDKTEGDGRATTSSTIPYLDDKPGISRNQMFGNSIIPTCVQENRRDHSSLQQVVRGPDSWAIGRGSRKS